MGISRRTRLRKAHRPKGDRIVPISASQEMVEALKACGGNVKFTVYPEAEHDSWTETYNNPALFDWFRQHRRERVARSS
jgi:alpha-beta hydrolase superfamily lysophospholipase